MKAPVWIFVVVLLAGAFLLGRRSVAPVVETRETVRIDTVYRDRPIPVASTTRPATINIPRIIFLTSVERDMSEIPTDSSADSVAVEIQIETRTYRDSLLTAQVSGPVVGDYRPALDWYEVYSRTRTITQSVVKRHWFAVTAGIGAAYTPNGIQPVAGIQVGVVLWSF